MQARGANDLPPGRANSTTSRPISGKRENERHIRGKS